MILRTPLVLLILLGTVLLVCTPALENDYTMDDRLVAMGTLDSGLPNPAVEELHPISFYFTKHYWFGSQPSGRLFRPVTVYTFALRHHFFGDNPLPAHLANILAHLLAVLLVFALLRTLGTSAVPAAIGGAAFGLHGIHSEVIAGVVGRSELLAFDFGALALLYWHSANHSPKPRTMVVQLVGGLMTAGLMFLAFGSKESALAWVPFFFVYSCATHWAHTGASLTWREIGRLAGIVLVVSATPVAAYLYLRHGMLASLPAPTAPIAHLVNPIAGLPVSERVPTAICAWGFGLALTALPWRLAADYGTDVFPLVDGFVDSRVCATLVAFTAILLITCRYRLRWPTLFLGAAAFFGFSLLTSNVPLPIGTIFAERLYYTPSLGIAIAWATVCQGAAQSTTPRRWVWALVGAWLALNGKVLWDRHEVWRNDQRLFLHEVVSQPRSVRMHTTAATTFGELDAQSMAKRHLLEATRLDPEHALAWNNLGAIELDRGNLGPAEAHLRRGLAATHIQPDQDLFKLHCNLALVLIRQNDAPRALIEMQECLVANPGFIQAFEQLLTWLGSERISAQQLRDVLDRVSTRPETQPFVTIYRALLDSRLTPTLPLPHPQSTELDKRLDTALLEGIDSLPRFVDRALWQHRIGRNLAAAGKPDLAIKWFKRALVTRPHFLRSFTAWMDGAARDAERLEKLRSWLDDRDRTSPVGDRAQHTWTLYKGIAEYQLGIVQQDREVPRRGPRSATDRAATSSRLQIQWPTARRSEIRARGHLRPDRRPQSAHGLPATAGRRRNCPGKQTSTGSRSTEVISAVLHSPNDGSHNRQDQQDKQRDLNPTVGSLALLDLAGGRVDDDLMALAAILVGENPNGQEQVLVGQSAMTRLNRVHTLLVATDAMTSLAMQGGPHPPFGFRKPIGKGYVVGSREVPGEQLLVEREAILERPRLQAAHDFAGQATPSNNENVVEEPRKTARRWIPDGPALPNRAIASANGPVAMLAALPPNTD